MAPGDFAQAIKGSKSLELISGNGFPVEALEAAMERGLLFKNVGLDIEHTQDIEFDTVVNILKYKNVLQGYVVVCWAEENSTQLFLNKTVFEMFFRILRTTKFEIYWTLASGMSKQVLNKILEALSQPSQVKELLISVFPKLIAKHVAKLHVRELRVYDMKLLSEPGFVEAMCQNHEITKFMSEDENFHGKCKNGDVNLLKLEYTLGLNYVGRRILKHKPVALNLWPLVLARSNTIMRKGGNTTAADCIYYLLRGKAGELFEEAAATRNMPVDFE